ncbi:hypothetical protein [Rubinisphaera italica]|uniref:Uncharacterized protein n=1 Tax=Rubinisphaera italica TaxID=2527969 RepID=A0A5C5XJ52_9PLAN|nr:hypothetical protein [Rubinisphaera italica]TWT63207.1 hypothetical protein Pan54_39600 [Rubinisphaera italica]
MGYQRLILHYGYDPEDFLGVLSQGAVKRCWFELDRLGGCGAGELRLNEGFSNRDAIEPGHWIAFEYSTGERWYLGRVEDVESESPAGLRIRLEGPAIQLNEVFPGSFTAKSEGVKPHRYGRTDQFGQDPDYDQESQDYVVNSAELIRKMIEQYVVGKTNIIYDPDLVETGPLANDVTTMKFRGEESVRSVIKDLALRARNATWGVDAERRFFFRQRRDDVLAEYREHRDLTKLQASRSRELLFNRVMLTGDYVYDFRNYSSQLARRSYRWRGNYRQPTSIDQHGERRIRVWVPWIRTAEDSRSFVSEFFRIYSQPVTRFSLQTKPQSVLPLPWEGCVRLKDRNLSDLEECPAERIRVLFDHAPQFQIALGPGDPRELWPEPPHDERWELPEKNSGNGDTDLTNSEPSLTSVSGSGGGSTNPGSSSAGESSDNGFSETSAASDHSLGSSEDSMDSQTSSHTSYSSSTAESSSGMDVTSSNGESSELNSSEIGSSGSGGSSVGESGESSIEIVSSGNTSVGVTDLSGGATSSNQWDSSGNWNSGGGGSTLISDESDESTFASFESW